VTLFMPGASFGQAPPACANQTDLPTDVGPQTAAGATLCLLNQIRVGQGLTPLRANPQLAEAAQVHASDMVTNHYFDHDSLDGGHFDDRIKATGYYSQASLWWLGENLAWGTQQLASPQAIVNAWMNSQGHRDNILDNHYLDIGIAIVTAAPTDATDPGATYVTEFGQIQVAPRAIRASHKAHPRGPKPCPGLPQTLPTVSEHGANSPTSGCVFVWKHA
jgi:uncharacterized protein YkwD